MSPVILLALIEQHMLNWTLCNDTFRGFNCEEYIIILRVHISTELNPSLTAKQNERGVYDWLWVTADVTTLCDSMAIGGLLRQPSSVR